jgi:NADH dehydrogenase
MRTNKVCILGGSGFVGSRITEQLAERGLSVKVLTRLRERAKHLIVLPTVEVVEANVHNEAELAAEFADMDAVINLVGVLHDGRGRNSFGDAHVLLAEKVINACEKSRVRRLLHMSALKAHPDGPSEYLASKDEAEAMVRTAAADIAVTVFRPSVIFGPGDSLLNRFAALIENFPVLPLAGANARFQPVYVEDVARVFSESLDRPESYGRSYDVCGPRVYTLLELMRYTAELMQKKRVIFPLSPGLAKWQALLLEFVPGKPMTRDNLRSMEVDSVCDCEFELQFGFQPASLAAIAPTYIAGRTPRGRYSSFRYRAGR